MARTSITGGDRSRAGNAVLEPARQESLDVPMERLPPLGRVNSRHAARLGVASAVCFVVAYLNESRTGPLTLTRLETSACSLSGRSTHGSRISGSALALPLS